MNITPEFREKTRIFVQPIVDAVWEKHGGKIIEAIEATPIPDENSKPKKRKRGPSADVLALCKDAMAEWLDQDKPITKACQLTGIEPKTVRRWIPNVLKTIEPGKREIWISKLSAYGEPP